MPPCAEDVIGITFYRLMFTDMATACVVNFAEAIVKRGLLRMAMPVDPPAVRLLITRMLPLFLPGKPVHASEHACKHFRGTRSLKESDADLWRYILPYDAMPGRACIHGD